MINRNKILENIPDIPKKGILRRLILQIPEVDFINNLQKATKNNDLIIPEEFWGRVKDIIDE